MIFKINLHPEVVKFLDETGTIVIDNGEKYYIVNNTMYTETDEEGLYIAQFIEQKQK
jgi:hypothetical protein